MFRLGPAPGTYIRLVQISFLYKVQTVCGIHAASCPLDILARSCKIMRLQSELTISFQPVPWSGPAEACTFGLPFGLWFSRRGACFWQLVPCSERASVVKVEEVRSYRGSGAPRTKPKHNICHAARCRIRQSR
jgi:hypothetical protein